MNLNSKRSIKQIIRFQDETFLPGSGKKGDKNGIDFDQYERGPGDRRFNKNKYNKSENKYLNEKIKDIIRTKKNRNTCGYKKNKFLRPNNEIIKQESESEDEEEESFYSETEDDDESSFEGYSFED